MDARARRNRNLDRISTAVAALTLAIVLIGIVRDTISGDLDALLWQILAALGFALVLNSQARIHLYAATQEGR